MNEKDTVPSYIWREPVIFTGFFQGLSVITEVRSPRVKSFIELLLALLEEELIGPKLILTISPRLLGHEAFFYVSNGVGVVCNWRVIGTGA